MKCPDCKTEELIESVYYHGGEEKGEDCYPYYKCPKCRVVFYAEDLE